MSVHAFSDVYLVVTSLHISILYSSILLRDDWLMMCLQYSFSAVRNCAIPNYSVCETADRDIKWGVRGAMWQQQTFLARKRKVVHVRIWKTEDLLLESFTVSDSCWQWEGWKAELSEENKARIRAKAERKQRKDPEKSHLGENGQRAKSDKTRCWFFWQTGREQKRKHNNNKKNQRRREKSANSNSN